MLALSLIQSQSATRMPWGVMIVSTIIVVIGVLLVVYFFKRFKTTESDTEEDQWGLPGGLGLRQDSEQKGQPGSSMVDLDSPDSTARAARFHESDTLPFGSVGPGPKLREFEAEELEPRLQPSSPVMELDPLESVKQQTRKERPVSPPAPAEQPEPSPFGDEIWSHVTPQPNQAQPAAPQSQSRGTSESRTREPYEPPRIEPIVPRKQGGNAPTSLPIPEVPLTASSAAQRVNRSEAQLVRTPEPIPPASQPQPEQPSPAAGSFAQSGAGAPHIEYSLASSQTPSQASNHASGHDDIGTLAHYGEDAKDDGSRAGTVALAVIVLVIVAAVLSYLFIPSVHSAVARMRGQAASEDVPKAQIFTERGEATNNIWKIKGTLQNVSQDALSDLVVGINLEPRAEGATSSIELPVTPDQIGAGQAGNFDFEIDAQKFKGYRVVKLTTKSGKAVPFAAPKTTATAPGQQ